MARQRARPAPDAPAVACHRVAIGALIAANVAVCAASFICLRLIGRAEGEQSYQQPEIDLSGLYDDPVAQTPSPRPPAAAAATKGALRPVAAPASAAAVVAAGGAAASTEAPLPPSADGAQPQSIAGVQPVPAVTAQPARSAPAPAATAAAPVAAVQPFAGAAGARAAPLGGASSRAAATCRGPVTGPLPTTACGRQSCAWEAFPQRFVSDFAAEVDFEYPLEVAKTFCIELGSLCSAVVCKPQKPEACTVRSGTELLHSTLRETALVKRCGAVSGSESDDKCASSPPPSPAPHQPGPEPEDLRGAAVVVLAHNRKDDLKQCLESLLGLPDVGIFHLHVSLDDATAEPSMRAVVEDLARAKGTNIEVWLQPPIVPDPGKHGKEVRAWFKMNAGKIAHHYWTVLEKTFMEYKYEHAIFVEEDLVFSPDFLALFRSTVWLLRADPSLWCVSAWSDFGSAAGASDQCRLQRSSYFPGLGFLLPRAAWLRLREVWPTAPTMGWDYWMRVAFRTENKECIIPEVSRSHHISTGGSSITKSKQLKLLRLMAFAEMPNSCGEGACHQFGDVSYLLEEAYEKWMRAAIAEAPRVSQQDLQHLKPDSLCVLPIGREDLRPSLAEKLGLAPKGTSNAIPADMRSEHYGVVVARHVQSRARVLLVDRRSPRAYLGPGEQLRLSDHCVPVAGGRGESCAAACTAKGLRCDATQMYFLNTCQALRQHFPCEEGCAHQVGKELPVYVPDAVQPTHRQCLVTFISRMSCEAKHASTARLCACMPPSAAQR